MAGSYDGPVVVRREQHHLDLVVHLPGCAPLVIENKVFSPPDEKQLDDYVSKNIPAAGLTSPSLGLLSLSDPGWPQDRYGGWRWMPYSQVAGRLSELLDAGAVDDPFVDGLLRRWVRMLGDLQSLVDATQPTTLDEPLLLDGDVVAVLESVKLHDALQKFRSRSVLHLLGHRFAAEDLRPDSSKSEFTNGSPLLSVGVELPNRTRIGWQLQGQQWRRFLIVPEELSGQSPEKKLLQDDYAGSLHDGWFDFTAEQSLGPFQPAPTSTFKHYAPDFVYDYVKVPGATVGQVLELGVVVLRVALAYRDELLRRR